MDYDLFNNPNNGLLSEISQDRMNSAPPSQGMYLQVAYQILASNESRELTHALNFSLSRQ
jgi:hypothetical protein